MEPQTHEAFSFSAYQEYKCLKENKKPPKKTEIQQEAHRHGQLKI